MASQVRFISFPRTKPPPAFVPQVVSAFHNHEEQISTVALDKGLESDDVLQALSASLQALGFQVEASKAAAAKLARPVFFGEGGKPTLRYEIDGYHPEWRCGLEVEAGRGILGNAIFRDLFQAMLMVDVDHLCLAIPLTYKYKSRGKPKSSRYYEKAVAVADALYGHSRVAIPYGLTVIGY
ncbi:hypothetical protein R5W24_006301 [Gemmata sp. JC717]|uniref:hypothetical protein n=1 Tax=Gemmata algarum TaxID=2975278 RepID=UPI0021BB1952|nr:hypothetical protein [Gemmata algarum]MDY3557114.1 hypothetical protein [Gemmata algarum]